MANFGNFITKYIVRPLYPAPAPVQLPVIMTDIILASSPTDLRPKATHHSQSWVECSRENAREGVHSGTGTADENVASYLTKMERSNVSESVLHNFTPSDIIISRNFALRDYLDDSPKKPVTSHGCNNGFVLRHHHGHECRHSLPGVARGRSSDDSGREAPHRRSRCYGFSASKDPRSDPANFKWLLDQA
ncbi:hypothetical protein C8R43DRAFT_957643 [Mycena crocata]|nr:hypothetical protein C8R43DRAFT_957643 [Mycena crocata]